MTTRRLREWCGGALLFVAYDFLWVGFAAALLLSGEDSSIHRYRDGVCCRRERGVRR